MAHEDRSQAEIGLRRRRAAAPDLVSAEAEPETGPRPEKQKPDAKQVLPSKPGLASAGIGAVILVIALAIPVALMIVVNVLAQRGLYELSQAPPTPKHPFEAKRAMDHVRVIAARPRWVGTNAMHDSLLYIQSELLAIKPMAERHGLELDVEMTVSGSGSYLVDIANIDLILSYSNITNVVARLRPAHLTHDTDVSSLLINAHADSAPSSPGASDNVCGVGVAMEVLRCLASSDVHKLARPVVFLFNGAEEAILVGAHAFIKEHPWARTIAAHINLESLGPGDTYHLFRLGPHSPWLAEAYANAVSIPSTSVTASDLFDSKVIPGETDFRVFAEFADIPGYDFVLLDNGYVYHSIYDSVEKVDERGLHHGGRTIIELVMELAGKRDAIGKHESQEAPTTSVDRLHAAAVKLANSFGLVKDPTRPKVVFFDILRFKTVVYEEGAAAIIHTLVLFLTAIIWIAKLTDMDSQDVKACFRMLGILLCSIPATFASATFASLVYSEAHKSKLRWYGDWRTAAIMYGPPSVFAVASSLLLFLPRKLPIHRFEHMLFALTLSHAVTALGLMSIGFMSSFVPIVFLMADNACAIQGEKLHPFLRHLQLCLPHVILGSKLITTSLSSVLPILGRIRSETVPHDTVAALVLAFFAFCYVLQPSLPILCHFGPSLRRLQMASFFASVGVGVWLVMFVPAMEGTNSRNTIYSSDAPKRIMAVHFYSPQQEPMSVIGIGSQDPVTMDTRRILSYSFGDDTRSSELAGFPLWGSLESTAIETFRPFRAFLQDVKVLGAAHPPALPMPTVEVVSEHEVDGGWNVTYVVQALDSHQLTVRFPVTGDSKVLDWSLDIPLLDSPGGTWIRHVGSSDCYFWVVLQNTRNSNARTKLRMAVTSGRLGISRSPDYLKKLVFEEWEAPLFFVSTGVELEL